MNTPELQRMVDELMEKNKLGTVFREPVPEDWPVEAWQLVLDAKSDAWDTESLHCWIAGFTYAPEKIVRILAESPYSVVRSRIASKRNLPKDLFPILARDRSAKGAVVANKKAPREVIEYLAKDKEQWIREFALKRLQHK